MGSITITTEHGADYDGRSGQDCQYESAGALRFGIHVERMKCFVLFSHKENEFFIEGVLSADNTLNSIELDNYGGRIR